MRRAALILVVLLAGCTSDEPSAHAADRWAFTERAGEDPDEAQTPIGDADGFIVERELRASAGMRQIGGQWHGALPEGVPFTLRFHASVDMVVQFRATTSGSVGTSGRCDWGADEAEKEVALGRARMSNTTRDCEIVFTPSVALLSDDGPTLRWEARRAVDAGEWSVAFAATR